MNIIDGKEIAKNLRSKIAEEVSTFERPPGLAVILVGEDPASAVYVRNKELACKQAGFFSDKIIKSENITEEQLLEEVERLNNNPQIDGILVQLPLPKHIDANKVIEHNSPLKDVDGFHSENIGKLMQNKSHLRPCTGSSSASTCYILSHSATPFMPSHTSPPLTLPPPHASTASPSMR